MKKFFFMAAMASVALASCVNDVSDVAAEQQKEITFASPVVSLNSRAVDEIADNYPTTATFNVWAYHYANGFNNFASGTLYINEKKATYNSSTWDFNPKYYWPKNGSLTFSAYSPASVEAEAAITATGITFTDYVVKEDLTNQVDLLFSERAYNQTFSTMDNETSVDPYKGVTVQFKHALSSIRFKVKTKANYGTTPTLVLKKIEILNAYSKGSFNQGLTDAASAQTPDIVITEGVYTAGTGWNYATQSEEKTYVAYESSPGITLSTTEQYTHSGNSTSTVNKTDLILLPQLLKHTPNNVQVRVTYDIKADGNPIEQVNTVDLVTGNSGYYKDGSDDIIAWERGKRYTYTINIGLEEITIEPKVTNWDNVDVTGSTLE